MRIRISTAVSVAFILLGVGSMVIPRHAIAYVGWPLLGLGILVGLWTLVGCLRFRMLTQLIRSRMHVTFLRADFKAIGMSSPYVDFYFNIHSCLSSCIMITGEKKGDLWNPCIEAWRSSWEIDTVYQNIIQPDTDIEVKIRWNVPQGHNSPMSEFAFRANDKPPVQRLSFEDIEIELKARFLRLEREIGWLQLSHGIVEVSVPDNPVFNTVRCEYLREKQ